MYADPTMESFRGATPVSLVEDGVGIDAAVAVADPDLALAILFLAPQPGDALEALIRLPTR